MQNVTVELSMHFPTRSHDTSFLCQIEVKDRASGFGICSIDLDAEQFGQLISGRYLSEVDAEVAERQWFEYVGKQREVVQVRPDRTLTDAYYGKDPSDAMVAWGDKQLDEHCYERGRWNRYNYGWGFTMERWS